MKLPEKGEYYLANPLPNPAISVRESFDPRIRLFRQIDCQGRDEVVIIPIRPEQRRHNFNDLNEMAKRDPFGYNPNISDPYEFG